MSKVDDIKNILEGKTAEEIIQWLGNKFGEKATFSTSLGFEDQVITHMIFSRDLPIGVFTLDTGRLFNETYSVLTSTRDRYKKPLQVYYPQTEAIQKLVSEKGPNCFYESVENRKECCYIRKVEPLKRALSGKDIWITGIRAEQSPDRKGMPMVEWDEDNKLIKVHPLLNWTLDEVKACIHKNNIPYNPLHDRGFLSIGCAPCTRAIKEGENMRAGRWWWEDNSKKECGLHIHK